MPLNSMEQVLTNGDAKRPTRTPGKPTRLQKQPGWADGLRKLYDDVVAEPLPESFEDLLKKLDQADDE